MGALPLTTVAFTSKYSEARHPKESLIVGFVVPEIIDGRFNPWEDSLNWESYLDFYCSALEQRGHTCVKYVPSIGVAKTKAYWHKFGHAVKRVPVFNRLLAPKRLFKT